MLIFSILPLAFLTCVTAIQSAIEWRKNEIWDRLGSLSPYHSAPAVKGVHADLPCDCTVNQIMLIGRHGSRYPLNTELPLIQNLTYKLGNHSDTIHKANLPPHLEFLKKGYTTSLGTNDLTVPGRQQLFNHGVDFRLKYPDLLATTVLAGMHEEVIESAQWFAQGYFGRAWQSLNTSAFSTINEDNATVSWITPMNTCHRWDYNYGNNATITWGKIYLPPITKRLNILLPGVDLIDDDTHGALFACAYDLVAYGVSPWCSAFTESELAGFEYEMDLLMDGAYGYNLPRKMGPILGSLYVNTLIERFTNSSGNASAVYLEFGHGTTIAFALTALGLVKDTPPLPAKGPIPANRQFRTSNQIPFSAQMIWEKFTCTSSFKGAQIRLVLNDATMPLKACAKSTSDKLYGSCSMTSFVETNKFSTSIKWGDSTWNESCGALA